MRPHGEQRQELCHLVPLHGVGSFGREDCRVEIGCLHEGVLRRADQHHPAPVCGENGSQSFSEQVWREVVHRQRGLEPVDGTRARRVGYRRREDDGRQASVAGGFGDPIGEVAHVGQACVIAVHRINLNRPRFAAQSIGGRVCASPVAAAEQDVPACSGKFSGRGIPDAARRTGHQHDTSHYHLLMSHDYHVI